MPSRKARARAALLFCVVALACDGDGVLQPTPSSLDAVLNAGGTMPDVAEFRKDSILSQTTETRPPDNTQFVCTTRRITLTTGNSEFPLFNPNASVVYPGNMLQGKSLQQATPDVIAVKRGGGAVSIDLLNGSPVASVRVDEVRKSTIAQALNDILRENSGIVPANFNIEVVEVQSQQQFALEIEVNLESKAYGEVEAEFEFSRDRKYNRFLVKLTQAFYTMSFDIPTSTAELFAPEVTGDLLRQHVQPGNPATYISDVTYGRIFYLLVESTSESEKIEAELDIAFKPKAVEGSVEVEVFNLNSLENRRIRMLAFGGEAVSTFKAMGESDDLSALVRALGESANINSGVPLSYVVRNAVDNRIVQIALAAEYDFTQCSPVLPPAIERPVFWFRADDGITTSGTTHSFWNNPPRQQIRSWRNAFAAGNDARSDCSNGSGSYHDTRVPFPYVRFAQDNTPCHRLVFSGQDFERSDFTVIAVVRQPATGVAAFNLQSDAFLFGSQANTLQIGWNHFDQPQRFKVAMPGSPVVLASTDTTTRAEWQVYTVTFSQDAMSERPGVTVYINGQVRVARTDVRQPMQTYLGASIGQMPPSGPSGPVPLGWVDIAELMGWGSALTAEQRVLQERRLRAKYGI